LSSIKTPFADQSGARRQHLTDALDKEAATGHRCNMAGHVFSLASGCSREEISRRVNSIKVEQGDDVL
jgi:hypothetical protein